MFKFLTKLLNANEKEISRIQPIVDRINSLDKDFTNLKDDEFKEKTAEFRQRLAKGETLDDLLPESFALVREAAKRVHRVQCRW